MTQNSDRSDAVSGGPDRESGATPLTMYGYTYDEWMNPARLRERAQREWDEYQAMSDAFERVRHPDHWKGPISGWVEAKDRAVTERAINHFAGGGAVFKRVSGTDTLWVGAPGYWVMVG